MSVDEALRFEIIFFGSVYNFIHAPVAAHASFVGMSNPRQEVLTYSEVTTRK